MTVISELITKLGFAVDKQAADQALAKYAQLEQAAQKLQIKLSKPLAGFLGSNPQYALKGAGALASASGGGSAPSPSELAPPASAISAWGVLKGAVGGFLALQGVQQLRAFTHEMMDQASQIDHLATRLGISTAAVQELQYAANDADVSTETLTTGLRTLQVTSQAAGKGSKEAAAAFKALGISGKEAANTPIDQLLERVADGLQGIADPAQRQAIAMKVLGRSSGELIPLLAGGAEGLKELRAEAVALGGGLDGAALDAAGALEKETKKLDFAMSGLKGTLATGVLPWITRLVEGGTKLASWFTGLTKSVDLFALAMSTAVLPVLVKFAQVYETFTAKAAWQALKVVGPWLLWGIAIAGVGLIIEDLYGLLTGKKSLIGRWVDEWSGLGTVDNWLRNIQAGLKAISEGGYWKSLKEAMGGIGEVVGKNSDARAFQEATRLSKSDNAGEREIGRRGLAGFARRGITAENIGEKTATTDNIPRALAPGLGADIAQLEVGRATVGENSRYKGDVNNITMPTQVIVQGDATDATVAKIHEVVNANNAKQAQHVREALVPKAAR